MGNGFMNGGNMMSGWSGGMIFGPFIMIGFFALVIYAIVLLVRFLSSGGRHSASSNEALNILNQRFAAGEIDANEYAERRDMMA